MTNDNGSHAKDDDPDAMQNNDAHSEALLRLANALLVFVSHAEHPLSLEDFSLRDHDREDFGRVFAEEAMQHMSRISDQLEEVMQQAEALSRRSPRLSRAIREELFLISDWRDIACCVARAFEQQWAVRAEEEHIDDEGEERYGVEDVEWHLSNVDSRTIRRLKTLRAKLLVRAQDLGARADAGSTDRQDKLPVMKPVKSRTKRYCPKCKGIMIVKTTRATSTQSKQRYCECKQCGHKAQFVGGD